MLRGLLLLGAALPLVGLGSVSAPHVRNGGRIAYVHLGGGNRLQIYTITATGAHRQALTASHKYSSSEPAYASGGKRIVFVRNWKESDLWTMRADGSRKHELIFTKKIWEGAPAWSPDGRQIVFEIEKPASLQGIWIMSANGRGRHRLTSGADVTPSWSPDGSTIAYAAHDAIYVVPAAGGPPTQLTFPGMDSEGQPYFDAEPTWSPNGSKTLFVSTRGDPAESADQIDLWVMNPDGTNPHHVTTTQSRDERDPAWSSDGKRIAYSGNGTFHGASSSQIYVSSANGSNRHILTHSCGDCAYINDEPSWRPLTR